MQVNSERPNVVIINRPLQHGRGFINAQEVAHQLEVGRGGPGRAGRGRAPCALVGGRQLRAWLCERRMQLRGRVGAQAQRVEARRCRAHRQAGGARALVEDRSVCLPEAAPPRPAPLAADRLQAADCARGGAERGEPLLTG